MEILMSSIHWKQISLLDEKYVNLAKENDVLGPNIQPNNKMQLKATKKALSSRFTLIQGPPGTRLLNNNDQTLGLYKMYLLYPPANEAAGVYSDPYVRSFVRSFVRSSVRPSLPISNPLLLCHYVMGGGTHPLSATPLRPLNRIS